MKKNIKITESQLKRCIQQVVTEQSSRLAAIKNSAPALNNSSSQQTYNDNRGGKPKPSSNPLPQGTYKNSTVKVNTDGSLEINIYGRGTFVYKCDGCKSSMKKIG